MVLREVQSKGVLAQDPSAYFHNIFIPAMMAKKQNIHKTIGPDAPRNLKPKAANSIGPVVAFSNKTMQAAEMAESGTPIHAANCASSTLVNQLVAEACPTADS